MPISISARTPDFQLKSPLSHAPLPPLTRKLVSVRSVVLGASWPLQGNDRNALQAVHFKEFELEIGGVTRYRKWHSLKNFFPPRPEVTFCSPLRSFETPGMGEEGVHPPKPAYAGTGCYQRVSS